MQRMLASPDRERLTIRWIQKKNSDEPSIGSGNKDTNVFMVYLIDRINIAAISQKDVDLVKGVSFRILDDNSNSTALLSAHLQ